METGREAALLPASSAREQHEPYYKRRSSSRGQGHSRRRRRSEEDNHASIEGDRQQRVTMVAPKSLKVLQARAKFLFGGAAGLLRLYHHGSVPIKGPEDFAHVQPGDLVVATVGEPQQKPATPGFAFNESTMKRDYVAYSPRPPSSQETPRPTRPSSKLRFEAKTSYIEDYVEKPYSKRQACKSPKTRPQVQPTGEAIKSHYQREYQSKQLDPAKPVPHAEPALQVFKSYMPLADKSSAMRDYASKKADPARLVVLKDNLHLGDHAFDGMTNYTRDYRLRPKAEQVSCRWAKHERKAYTVDAPLESETQYRYAYQGRSLDQPVVMHLEPAKGLQASSG